MLEPTPTQKVGEAGWQWEGGGPEGGEEGMWDKKGRELKGGRCLGETRCPQLRVFGRGIPHRRIDQLNY